MPAYVEMFCADVKNSKNSNDAPESLKAAIAQTFGLEILSIFKAENCSGLVKVFFYNLLYFLSVSYQWR